MPYIVHTYITVPTIEGRILSKIRLKIPAVFKQAFCVSDNLTQQLQNNNIVLNR